MGPHLDGCLCRNSGSLETGLAHFAHQQPDPQFPRPPHYQQHPNADIEPGQVCNGFTSLLLRCRLMMGGRQCLPIIKRLMASRKFWAPKQWM
jgi:hypothetical protein